MKLHEVMTVRLWQAIFDFILLKYYHFKMNSLVLVVEIPSQISMIVSQILVLMVVHVQMGQTAKLVSVLMASKDQLVKTVSIEHWFIKFQIQKF